MVGGTITSRKGANSTQQLRNRFFSEDEGSMLKGSDRKHLRGLAHHLKPVVQVGKQGLIENLITTVSQALDAHELIKVKFVDFKQQKGELSLEIATRTKSKLAGLVGNIAILYRPHSDEEKRKIRLPQSAH